MIHQMVYNNYVQYRNDAPSIHVINSIGYAFDSPLQPDYQYFVTDNRIDIRAERKNELIQKVSEMFKLVFVCANEINVTKIALAFVGGGAFTRYFPKGTYNDIKNANGSVITYAGTQNYFHTIFKPAIKFALEEMIPKLKKEIVQIGMLGTRLTPITKDAEDYVKYKISKSKKQNPDTSKLVSDLHVPGRCKPA